MHTRGAALHAHGLSTTYRCGTSALLLKNQFSFREMEASRVIARHVVHETTFRQASNFFVLRAADTQMKRQGWQEIDYNTKLFAI